MWTWERAPQLAAAEQAYVDAEMGRLRLTCQRNDMDRDEYKRQLADAWQRSVQALEILTALKNADEAARLFEAADKAQPA